MTSRSPSYGLAFVAGILGMVLGALAASTDVLPLVGATSRHGVSGARPPAGHWQQARAAASSLSSVPARRGGQDPLHALADLPYTRGSRTAPEVQSVAQFNGARAQPGVNLVLSGHSPSAHLIDMKGNVLHEWHKTFDEVWPDGVYTIGSPTARYFWRRAHLFGNGDLLAIFEGTGMILLDKDSNLKWAYDGQCHHDLSVTEDGLIYTLGRIQRTDRPEALSRFPTYLTGDFIEDTVLVLSADGELKHRSSILHCLLRSDYAAAISMSQREGDFLHTNTIEVMDGRFDDRHPLYRKGNVLVCVRNCNLLAVLDLEKQDVVWALQGMFGLPHEPTVIDNGNILVFDNHRSADVSRVLEINPLTREIVWDYYGNQKHPFHSSICGSNQRLANGNTLIVETTGGRAFEVGADRAIVWEFFNPFRAGGNDQLIASIFDCVRLDPQTLTEGFPEVAAPGPIQLDEARGLVQDTPR
ncbi:MAG: arylsulfotransferase family protein [Planctomycetota bacterium]